MLSHIETGKFRGRTVGVVLGGDSDEREVSLRTGRALTEALRSLGYDVNVYDVPNDVQRLVAERPAAVLLGLHGGNGENGVFQGFLEALNIPYSGSGVLASALAMDKARAKAVLRQADVPTPRSLIVSAARLSEVDFDAVGVTLGWPVVAKINDGGSSVGVHLAQDAEALKEAIAAMSGHAVLLEEYIAGDEYTVGFFDDVCLGVINVKAANAFYDYEAKYASNKTQYLPLAEGELHDRVVAVGRKTYEALGCRGVARIDVMARDRELYVLEANTIPGMTETSLVPKMARRLGLSFAEFTERMLDACRCG